MFGSFSRRFGRFAMLGAVVAASFAVPVLAQTGPPPMDPVEFPLDPVSVGSELSGAAVVVLGIVFTIGLGFMLIKKLFRRLKGAI